MYISLRVKILALLFILITGLALVFGDRSTKLIFEKTQEIFQSRFVMLLNSVRAYWENEQNQLLRTATLFAESEKILNYSIYGLNNLLLREIKRLVVNTGFREIEIHLKSGLILSSKQNSPMRDRPLDGNDPRITLSKVQIDCNDDRLQMLAVVPLHKLGDFIGLLTLKKDLDDASLKEMSKLLQVDVALSLRGNVVGSSLAGSSRRDMVYDIYHSPEKRERFFSLSLGGKMHSVAMMDLGETGDRNQIKIYCAISQEDMLQLISQARTETLNLTLAALVVSLFLSILFSERVLTARIRQIRDGSKFISQEDLTYRLPENWHDELGDLARAFNEMAKTIKANRDKLVSQNEQLQHYIESLEQLKTYIQNILGSLGTGVITWNRQGRIETANSAAERELKEFYAGLKAMTIRGFLKPMNSGSRKTLLRCLRALVEKGVPPVPFDLEFDLGPNRGFKVMQSEFTYLRDTAQNPYGMVLTLDNITQRRIIEQQLYHADKLSSIGQLAASVAHEIKNPLASIKTLGQLLQEEIPPKDQKREYIDVIVSEVNRLNSVVEQLLKYAKPEESSFKRVKFSEVIAPVLALVHHEAERHRVAISAEFADELHVYVDAEKIKQVFLNLIFNSLQAIENGGNITIRAFQDPASPWTVCRVQDTGAGMPSEIVDHIFDPFFTTKQRGTGLGLAIVKKIIDLHGGKIEVKSRPNEGSTFNIYLPLERKE